MELSILIWYAESISGIKSILVLASVAALARLITRKRDEQIWKMAVAIFIMMVIAAITPGQKSAYLMAGGYLTEKLSVNESNADMYNNLIRVINLRLEGHVYNLSQKKGK